MGKVCNGTNVALIATLLMFYLPGIVQDGVDATLQKRLRAASHMVCAKVDDSCSVLFALGVAMLCKSNQCFVVDLLKSNQCFVIDFDSLLMN